MTKTPLFWKGSGEQGPGAGIFTDFSHHIDPGRLEKALQSLKTPGEAQVRVIRAKGYGGVCQSPPVRLDAGPELYIGRDREEAVIRMHGHRGDGAP